MGIEGRKQGDYFQTNPLARPKPASYTKKTAAGSGTYRDRFSLDLDPVALANQRADLQQGVGRPDVTEVSAVHCAHVLPVAGVAQVDPSAHHVVQPSSQREDAGRDLVQDVGGLGRSVVSSDQLPAAVRGRGARNEDTVADAHRARVTRKGLPNAAAADAPAVGVARHWHTLPHRRQGA